MCGRGRVLSLYRQILRLGRTWRAADPHKTLTEREYIRQHAGELFRKNKQLTDDREIAEKIEEAETRIALALHYGTPYPRPVYTPPNTFAGLEHRGRTVARYSGWNFVFPINVSMVETSMFPASNMPPVPEQINIRCLPTVLSNFMRLYAARAPITRLPIADAVNIFEQMKGDPSTPDGPYSNCEVCERKVCIQRCFSTVPTQSGHSGYELRVLKLLASQLQSAGLSVPECLYEAVGAALVYESSGCDEKASHFIRYFYLGDDFERMFSIEDGGIAVAHGTTGLTMWKVSASYRNHMITTATQASLALLNHLHTNPQLILNKRTIELGSGIGFLGIGTHFLHTMSQSGPDYQRPKMYWLTDCSDRVLNICRENVERNNLGSMCSVRHFDWCEPKRCYDAIFKSYSDVVDVILAADVCFDLAVLPSLAASLLHILSQNRRAIGLVTGTLRCRDTLCDFLQRLSQVGLRFDLTALQDLDLGVGQSKMGAFLSALVPAHDSLSPCYLLEVWL